MWQARLFGWLGAVWLSMAWPSEPLDHDRVREAMLHGEILPLATLLARLKRLPVGELIGVEVENKDGRWVYELKMIDAEGRVLEWYVDARDGTLLKSKIKKDRKERR